MSIKSKLSIAMAKANMPKETKLTKKTTSTRPSASLSNPYSKSKDYLSLSTGSVKKESSPSRVPSTSSTSSVSSSAPAKPSSAPSTSSVKSASNQRRELKNENKLKKIQARGNKRADIIAGTREGKKINAEKMAATTGALGGVLTLFDQARKSFSNKKD